MQEVIYLKFKPKWGSAIQGLNLASCTPASGVTAQSISSSPQTHTPRSTGPRRDVSGALSLGWALGDKTWQRQSQKAAAGRAPVPGVRGSRPLPLSWAPGPWPAPVTHAIDTPRPRSVFSQTEARLRMIADGEGRVISSLPGSPLGRVSGECSRTAYSVASLLVKVPGSPAVAHKHAVSMTNDGTAQAGTAALGVCARQPALMLLLGPPPRLCSGPRDPSLHLGPSCQPGLAS